MGVSNIDLKQGTYDVDFIRKIHYQNTEKPIETSPFENIIFVNGDITKTSEEFSNSNFQQERFQGTFRNQFDLQNYPFHRLELKIIFEPNYPYDVDKIKIIPISANHSDDIIVLEGDLKDTESKSEITHHPHGDYSRYIVTYLLFPTLTHGILKVMFPIIVLSGIAVLAFWISPEQIETRIFLPIGSLISLVAFDSMFLTEQLPSLGYLTIADNVMITSYVLFFYVIICSVILKNNYSTKDQKILKVNSIMRKLIPAVVSIVLIPLLLIHFS